ncbi:xanthine dehydrogenase family protein molybdopterin-binding subunit [Frankia sp. AgB1.9]|uniref:xanthine dehydrogenase family protein molybdopterin-binding subunit n=1 Tax=unclassified Frankia TaxID=2632575 RepID=UPI0019329FB6|nr:MULTISPECIES: xanthine dehydrogenase family protein molybdopterin-binding subunit [unclassified Frankia]MBL7493354.1 xanthine dehydrogenase family protein molybdopterin-binding subunit [Frankia sp. AgW1.1]MBL7552899.1 xanthine dehydrogenase family protein molybdopterin-binding subunit [Frankia sp. AgB1.9]MBL7621074.1 xanthine dehydrogenase family protein molybdopterin-binding subunit [Frankia sp. AgB1.8]
MTDTAMAPAVAQPPFAGRRVRRVEDARLLTGHGTFVDDIQRPGMLHACFVRSPFARALINGIDVSAALDLPGVHAVYTAADLNPEVHEAWYSSYGPKVPDTPRPPLAVDEVRFVGDPVALVIAESRYIAEDAVELVDVDYEPLPVAADYRQARGSEAVVHPAFPDNVAGGLAGPPLAVVEPAFAAAAHVADETFYQQAYQAVPMETRGLVVEWIPGPDGPDSGELTVWAATQTPHEVRAFGARLLGLDPDRVRVIMRDTGGGFGQKVVPMREDMCLLLVARKVAAPVKWIEDRRENLMSAGQARHEHGRARIAFDADAAITAVSLEHVQDCGAYPTPWPVGASGAVGLLFPGPYKVPLASWQSSTVFSNTAGRTAYRGPWQFESVAREVLLDIAARDMGLDPVELRRRNMIGRDDQPYPNPAGMPPYDHSSPLETFELALKILDYDAFRAEQAAARKEGRYLGVGTGTYIEPTATGQPYYASEGAVIRIDPTGLVTVIVNGGAAGNSLETTVIQLTADALGVDFDQVVTIQGDTAVTPFGAGTAGSRSGSAMAGAVAATATVLRAKLTALAAERLGVPEDAVTLADGRASAGDASVSYGELASPDGVEATATHTQKAPMLWSNATHVCTCEVDIATGKVTLLRYVVGEDVGPMINPNVVEGQIAGGTVQGIGGALLEHMVYDADGNPMASTFVDYLLPTSTEVPHIEYGHMETPAPGPGGHKGAGEGGAIGAPPAVINAVADALAPLGVKLTELPLSPSALVELLVAAGH